MTNRNRPFTLDKEKAMLLGVCSGLARYSGIDATIIRVGLVIGTLLGGFPWTLIGYGVAAFVYHKAGVAAPSLSDGEAVARLCDMDRRMQEIDRTAGTNQRLAAEIDSLK